MASVIAGDVWECHVIIWSISRSVLDIKSTYGPTPPVHKVSRIVCWEQPQQVYVKFNVDGNIHTNPSGFWWPSE